MPPSGGRSKLHKPPSGRPPAPPRASNADTSLQAPGGVPHVQAATMQISGPISHFIEKTWTKPGVWDGIGPIMHAQHADKLIQLVMREPAEDLRCLASAEPSLWLYFGGLAAHGAELARVLKFKQSELLKEGKGGYVTEAFSLQYQVIRIAITYRFRVDGRHEWLKLLEDDRSLGERILKEVYRCLLHQPQRQEVDWEVMLFLYSIQKMDHSCQVFQILTELVTWAQPHISYQAMLIGVSLSSEWKKAYFPELDSRWATSSEERPGGGPAELSQRLSCISEQKKEADVSLESAEWVLSDLDKLPLSALMEQLASMLGFLKDRIGLLDDMRVGTERDLYEAQKKDQSNVG